MVIVSDTSPIINLAIIGHLDLIPRLFNKVILPQAVFDEIVHDGAGLPGADEIRKAKWLEIMVCQDTALVSLLSEELDPGESEAIALALETHADFILMDEDLGRRIALRYHLQPLGVLGILLRAKSEGFISVVKPCMDDLIQQAGFFIHTNLYQDVLLIAGE